MLLTSTVGASCSSNYILKPVLKINVELYNPMNKQRTRVSDDLPEAVYDSLIIINHYEYMKAISDCM